MRSTQMKQEPFRLEDILSSVLIGCRQILVGTAEWAFECHSNLEEIEGLGICEQLMKHKKASFNEEFDLSSNDLIQLISREDCKPAKLAEVEQPQDMKKYATNRLQKSMANFLAQRKLEIVNADDKDFNEVCSDFFNTWRICRNNSKLRSEICHLVGEEPKERSFNEVFVEYQKLFLRESDNEFVRLKTMMETAQASFQSSLEKLGASLEAARAIMESIQKRTSK
eukprot:Gregarina_sp_Poly_1__10892@NODE_84_length_15393_cov_100_561529_g72_i0_p8_GENE_NODE_84_length_15393_cov_100_561529_g72_i0NODE_84_length_15393_cov_100_561529_g72_i0_p8_ORF_typecomplete_len225_score38_50RAI1/PF08652_11/64RAI1/PF08652_11/8_1_NODE_84_length_15393_cov_100_561529_g72_i04771151